METHRTTKTAGTPSFRARAMREPQHVRRAAIIITAAFLSLFLILPIVAVFTQALARGAGVYFRTLAEPETLAAVRLTLFIAAVAVPLNLIFGVLSSWAIAKFDFRGKKVLVTLIDLP